MEKLFIATESDFRKWIKEAVIESLGDVLLKDVSTKEHGEQLISRKETAMRLKISLVTLTDWVKHGLPSHKHRGRVYFLYSEVLDYIKRYRLKKEGFIN
jgi:hypothetical protein